MTLTGTEALDLAAQVSQDGLMFNTLNHNANFPLPGALTWGGIDFATYVLTSNAGALAQYLPGPTSNGNADAFITGVFTNALGRSPTASDMSFYEHVVSSAPSAFHGFAEVVMYVGLSPESYQHNHGLGLIIT